MRPGVRVIFILLVACVAWSGAVCYVLATNVEGALLMTPLLLLLFFILCVGISAETNPETSSE